LKAAKILGDRVGIKPHLHFELAKTIPSEAGLGGGSADAAAALVGCNILWNANVSDEDLMDLAAYIGEDVPFFIKGLMALNLGHKQPLIPLETSGKIKSWHWALGIPPRGLSTKAVFQKHDELLPASPSSEDAYLLRRQGCIDAPWGTASPDELLSALQNDLELPSTQLLPDIAIALQAGKSVGAVKSLMSGSGSTCAFLASDEKHARALAEALQRRNVFRAVFVASGPVEGVKVNFETNQ
jgi:4-diphosphocytidyl-2-C-methyl-D-erythritol kinase